MFESQRRSLLKALNSRYIYGKLPLLHLFIFLFEMAAVSLLIQKFNSYYAQKPLLTTMITNAVLGGIADTTAQILTSIRRRPSQARKFSGAITQEDYESFELNEKSPDFDPRQILHEQPDLPPPFDFERLTRFMSYGFLMTPLQFKWYRFLGRAFPITKTSGTVPALQRVAFDQLIYAPMGLGAFFTFMTVAEGGGRRAISKKLQDAYIPALKANYIIWPAVQIINFRWMPLQLQIPFVSTIGIAWTAYLSLTNASD